MMAPVPPPVPPVVGTADLGFTFTVDSAGVAIVDLQQTPAGDLLLLTGGPRLAQDVLIWLLVPQGSDQTDPPFGNPLFGLVGRAPLDNPLTVLSSMVDQAEAAFLARQVQEVALGLRTTDEQVQAFSGTRITPLFAEGGVPLPDGTPTGVAPMAYRITFNIITTAGTVLPVTGTVPGAQVGAPSLP